MSKKKKKQLTTNQQEWQKARANLRRNITNMKKMGLYIPESEELYNLERPERVTKKRLQQIKELSNIENLAKKAFRMNYNTGETLNDYHTERIENRKRKKRKRLESEIIIDNIMKEIDSLPEQFITVTKEVKKAVEGMLESIGKAGTIEKMQEIAHKDLFYATFTNPSPPRDGEEEIIATKNIVATLRAVNISEQTIDFILYNLNNDNFK